MTEFILFYLFFFAGGVDRSVPKTDFGADCMIVYTYKSVTNDRLKRRELISVNYISIKCFKKGEDRLHLAHKPRCADP